MGKHIIYRHIFPNDKSYVGQCQGETIEDAKRRWGSNGNGYRAQLVYKAIKKYGWENIQHEILEVVDNQDTANDREIYYIALYDSTVEKNGYNVSVGGLAANKGKNSHTKEKQGIYRKKFDESHREELRKKSREYYYEHKESRNEKMKEWYSKTKDERKKYYEERKEIRSEYHKKYYEEHKEKYKEYRRKKRIKNNDGV